MVRLTLSYDKTCQTLTGLLADPQAGCLLASVMIAYDVHQPTARKMLWSDVMLTAKNTSPHMDFVRQHASSMVSGSMLRYLSDRNKTDGNLAELLRGLTHPSELLMVLGSFNVVYEVDDPQILVDIARQFSHLSTDDKSDLSL
jgi:hypothetical protein